MITIINLDIINIFKKIKAETNPSAERPEDFNLETEVGIREIKFHPSYIFQALLRAKCLEDLLINFSLYSEEEIKLLSEFLFFTRWHSGTE